MNCLGWIMDNFASSRSELTCSGSHGNRWMKAQGYMANRKARASEWYLGVF